jgi:hypothetical protein
VETGGENMLTGASTITINGSTLIAAVQFYFDTCVFAEGKSPVVKSVAATTTYEGAEFIVKVSQRETEPAS